ANQLYPSKLGDVTRSCCPLVTKAKQERPPHPGPLPLEGERVKRTQSLPSEGGCDVFAPFPSSNQRPNGELQSPSVEPVRPLVQLCWMVICLFPATVPAAEEVPLAKFTDITSSSGIAFTHVNGAYGDKLLPETMGGGVAFFDFDSDGKQDLLFINSS